MDMHYLRSRHMTQPFEVSIETLTQCNARCTFCPYPTMERIGTAMPWSLIERMFVEMSGWNEEFYISPFKVNEPLLDKRLRTICKFIASGIPKARIRLFTNGSPLTADAIAWIAELPRDRFAHLWISLNSTDADEYEKLMGINFLQTARRLDALHDARASGDFPHAVVVSRVLQSHGPVKIIEAGTKDEEFFDDVAKRWPLFRATPIKRDGWLGYVEPNLTEVPLRPCGRWFELSILSTGVASLCCMDGKGEYPIGNVHHQTLTEIYNNPRLRNWREFAVTRTGINPCSRCTY